MSPSWDTILGLAVILSASAVLCLPRNIEFRVIGPRNSHPLPPEYHNEQTILTVEGKPSQLLSVYDNSHSALANIMHPEPIVDTIREQDKYGNTGEKLNNVGRQLINGFEAFSNILNTILDTPGNITKQISRGITDKLNMVGQGLVGL